MLETLAYLAFLKFIAKPAAESHHMHKASSRERRLDAWCAARGFNRPRQLQLEKWISDDYAAAYKAAYGVELKGAKAYPTQHPSLACYNFPEIHRRETCKKLCEKEGFKYFEKWEWMNDPSYKQAARY